MRKIIEETLLDIRSLPKLTKENTKSGITVALVNIPLSIALAVAAGIPPNLGIITAIWGGLTAAIFGSSHGNVIAPAAVFVGMITAFTQQHGISQLPMLTITASGFLILFFIFRFHRFVRLVPASVLDGFVLGIAFIISMSQLNYGFGVNETISNDNIGDTIVELFYLIPSIEPIVFALFVLAIIFLLSIPSWLPGALILFPIGIVITSYTPYDFYTLHNRFPDFSFLLVSPISHFSVSYDLIRSAFAIALVCMLDGLLAARIASRRAGIPFNEHKELFGLSMGNLTAGIAGGMPVTASMSRTSLNVQCGATHRTSAGVNVLVVLAVCAIFFETFALVPMVIISAILVNVAFRMVHFKEIIHNYKNAKTDFFITMLTATICIIDDPLTGILSGMAASLLIEKAYNYFLK